MARRADGDLLHPYRRQQSDAAGGKPLRYAVFAAHSACALQTQDSPLSSACSHQLQSESHGAAAAVAEGGEAARLAALAEGV
jgi:hypothetical protein